MRSEREMLDLILETARGDERIRAVILSGSRANPEARRDPFQDYDVLFLVTELESFKHNLEWIRRFGELMILQMPEEMLDPPPENEGGFSYLMQFSDGTRIDLGLYPLSMLDELRVESLSVALLDKDGRLGSLPPPNQSDYLPRPPSAKAFADCCNEFWWVNPYVAKGLWRAEIVYAKSMLEGFLRPQLMKMILWYVAVNTGFTRNPGKFGKYLQRYLEPELWELLMKTYSDAGYENTWEALFRMGDLFRRLAEQVADHFGFDYPKLEDGRVTDYLQRIQNLPRDAQDEQFL
jgi:aminoglycoside 6-adenylyltransferase